MENSLLERLEDVVERTQASAGTMLAAANRMHSAVATQDSSLTAFMAFMDNWMTRFEAAMGKRGEDVPA